MIRTVLMAVAALFVLAGCASHTQDPNERMMDKVMGELDRDTAK